MELLLLEPVFKQMIWGGSRLKDDFGYDIPGDNTGECWAISAHKNGDCTIENSEFAGIAAIFLYCRNAGKKSVLFSGLNDLR